MLEPQNIVLQDNKGENHEFIISKFPAIQGREIIAKYNINNLPKIGSYKSSEEVMFLLMSYVSKITKEGAAIKLVTPELINNHVPDWEMLMKLEKKMIEYNCSFFRDGWFLTFLEEYTQKNQARISEILTGLSAQLLQIIKQLYKS